MMRGRASTFVGMVLAVVLCAVPGTARARTSFDFLFSMDRVNDDNEFFLNVAVSDYGYSQRDLEPVLPRLRYVEVDLPVVLFLAHECGRPPAFIVDLRAQGLSWSAIFGQVGVSYDVLFAGIDRDPGPPYGNAWGHWRNNRRGEGLSDNDIAGLVQVQIGARSAHMAPYELARARGQGRSIAVVVADKHGRPYDKVKKGKGPHEDKGKPRHHGPPDHH